MKNFIKILFVIIFVLVADLVTKHFLFSIEYFNLIPGVLSIATNGGNDGAAWGILGGETMTLIIVSCVMIIALLIFNLFVKKKNWFYRLAFGFIVGGAIGNLVDRIMLGYVRDFIFLDFMPTFPIFNIADSFICIGALMMILFVIFAPSKKKTEEKKD